MNIKEITEGKKVSYRLQGNILYLGDNDEIQIDLEQRQKDVGIAIDIYIYNAGLLQEGSGRHYAANILTPPRRYHDATVQTTDMQGNNITVTQKEPLPVDANSVTLQLWEIPEKREGGM